MRKISICHIFFVDMASKTSSNVKSSSRNGLLLVISMLVVLACGPLQGRQDGVEQVDHKLRSGQEECDKEYEEVCYDLLDVCPMFVREMLPYDVARLRGVPHFEVLHAGDPTGWISGEKSHKITEQCSGVTASNIADMNH